MASNIVNVNSALTFIASSARLPLDIVRAWYSNEFTYRSRPLNIRSAYSILKKMILIGFGVTLSNDSAYDSSLACSVNTFKALYNKLMSGKSWRVYPSYSNLSQGATFMCLNPQEATVELTGGGGGGSGGARTNFDGSGTLIIGAGGKGGRSSIYRNGTLLLAAEGGAGGVGQTAQSGSRDGTRGADGRYGETKTGRFGFNTGDKIKIYVGFGGGGSGGGVLRITKNNSAGTVTVATPSDCNGTDAVTAGNYDSRGAGGGAGGGLGYSDSNYWPGENSGGHGAASGGNGSYSLAEPGDFTNYANRFAAGGKGGDGRGDGSAYASGGAGGASAGAPGKGGAITSANGGAGGGGGGASGTISFLPHTAVYINSI